MARRVSQTMEMVHGSGTLCAGDPGVDTPVHLERFPAPEEASNGDRLLTVVSLGLVSMLGVLVARLFGP
jgi:hypothetical protein